MARLAASSPASARRRANLALASTLATLTAFTYLLKRHPPQATGLYPLCPFHQLTGLLCPGCGATRALAALLSGNLREALHCNPLAAAALVCTAVLASSAYVRAWQGRESAWPRIPRLAVATASLITLAFTIARNLP